MKKIISVLTVILLFSQIFTVNCLALDVSAHSAYVIDGEEGIAVYEKNANEKMGMASTTKIMTCLVAIENCPLEKKVAVSDKAIGVEGSSIYLQKGETLTMKHLLYALMLQSANDAATAIACEISGSIEGFAELMNKKAQELGLKNTHFTNPHGLYDENHYTTARDLALITKHALDNPTFREIVSTKKTVIPLNNDEGARALVNHNKLLRIYDGAIGVKTGFTKKTGRCLVSAAQKDDTTIIAVTLNAPDDWNDHKSMLDMGFDKIQTVSLACEGQYNCKVSVVGGQSDYVTLTNTEGLKYTYLKENANITSEIIHDRFIFAPVKQGEVIGHVVFYNNGEEIGRIKLTAQNSVEKPVSKKKLFGIF
jgi:D-alanyl-D-alanine carboxypeptidase